MFKKKVLHLKVPESTARSLLLSASLIISLFVSSSHAVLPVKTVVTTHTIEVSAVTTTVIVANAVLRGSPNVAAPENSENQESQQQAPEGATALDRSNTDSIPSTSEGYSGEGGFITEANEFWQGNYEQLIDSLFIGDGVDGLDRTFPDFDLVTESLHSIEIVEALNSILASPDSYTLIDIHYVLWEIAKSVFDYDLMRTLVINASLLDRSHMEGIITFNQLTEALLGRDTLLRSLKALHNALSRKNFDGNVTVMLINAVFSDLYNSIHATALNQFVQQLANGNTDDRTGYILNFLHAFAEISSEKFDGENHLEGNSLAYARSRAWFWLFRHVKNIESSPEGKRLENPIYPYSHQSVIFKSSGVRFIGSRCSKLAPLGNCGTLDST